MEQMFNHNVVASNTTGLIINCRDMESRKDLTDLCSSFEKDFADYFILEDLKEYETSEVLMVALNDYAVAKEVLSLEECNSTGGILITAVTFIEGSNLAIVEVTFDSEELEYEEDDDEEDGDDEDWD